ncbi:GNAT family N-acetyltransferase [candidate division WOR-3 bacterium]|nr:GNAT family N-acetyltransferase [candidate division WOR-3 bacterium]
MKEHMNLTDKNLRLRPAKLPEDIKTALPWYQDPEVLYFSEGKGVSPYDCKIVEKMYRFFVEKGEFYIIEIRTKNKWLPIGDAGLCRDSLPIVIGGKDKRSKGIGKRVLHMLIERARALGWEELQVSVYTYNEWAKRLYEGAGFDLIGIKRDKQGNERWRFCLKLKR